MTPVQILVPYDGLDPKTRLAELLDDEERLEFGMAMLRDVLDVVHAVGATPLVVTRAPLDLPEADVVVDTRDLSTAVNARLAQTGGTSVVVMADLPLLDARTLRSFLTHDTEVVLARGTGGGTNALLSRHPAFRVDYHGGSYQKHLDHADEIDASVTEVDSYRFAVDIDEPSDLTELLLHGEGEAASWLRSHGFEVRNESNEPPAVHRRPTVER